MFVISSVQRYHSISLVLPEKYCSCRLLREGPPEAEILVLTQAKLFFSVAKIYRDISSVATYTSAEHIQPSPELCSCLVSHSADRQTSKVSDCLGPSSKGFHHAEGTVVNLSILHQGTCVEIGLLFLLLADV